MKRTDHTNIIPFPGPADGLRTLQLRVELLLTGRPVWRRLLVPDSGTFWDLHVAIQDAFGWSGRHLHQFTVDDPAHGGEMRFGIPDDSGFQGVVEVLPGWEHRPGHYLRRDAPAILYLYDFAEEWQHAVELESVVRVAHAADLPRCLAGEGWPPDDDVAVAETNTRFAADEVVFSDPRRCWQAVFGHD